MATGGLCAPAQSLRLLQSMLLERTRVVVLLSPLEGISLYAGGHVHPLYAYCICVNHETISKLIDGQAITQGSLNSRS